jgi:hypothetical protein
LDFLMKPIPFLLSLVILASSFGRSVATLIRRLSLPLTDFVTVIRAIPLAMPTRPAQNHEFAAGIAIERDRVWWQLISWFR